MSLSTAQQDMVAEAIRLIDSIPINLNHSVAAAILTTRGRIITAVNMFHFSGSTCAEMSCLAKAASEGVLSSRVYATASPNGLVYNDIGANGHQARESVDCIVAVGDRGRGVINPCGRCRQIILDYFPLARVIVATDPTPDDDDDDSRLEIVPITDLMPRPYKWKQRQKGE
ncbi:hypothetical protein OIO90_001659 [Microbotryomycetes sp. JL221]|nr:hypothetical protein OIO90_001659 [Microbotryomycetes sp. JL221]